MNKMQETVSGFQKRKEALEVKKQALKKKIDV